VPKWAEQQGSIVVLRARQRGVDLAAGGAAEVKLGLAAGRAARVKVLQARQQGVSWLQAEQSKLVAVLQAEQ